MAVGARALGVTAGESPVGAVFCDAVAAPFHPGPRAVRVLADGRVHVFEGGAALHAAPVRRGGAVGMSSRAGVAVAHAVAFDVMFRTHPFTIGDGGAATGREPGSRADSYQQNDPCHDPYVTEELESSGVYSKTGRFKELEWRGAALP